jgi:hypothetical protein
VRFGPRLISKVEIGRASMPCGMGKVTRKTGIDKDQLHSAEELRALQFRSATAGIPNVYYHAFRWRPGMNPLETGSDIPGK